MFTATLFSVSLCLSFYLCLSVSLCPCWDTAPCCPQCEWRYCPHSPLRNCTPTVCTPTPSPTAPSSSQGPREPTPMAGRQAHDLSTAPTPRGEYEAGRASGCLLAYLLTSPPKSGSQWMVPCTHHAAWLCSGPYQPGLCECLEDVRKQQVASRCVFIEMTPL